jgi:hypothetical protein
MSNMCSMKNGVMTGGMRAGRGESLAARVAATQQRRAPGPPSIRHCWYDGPHGRQAALLLEWRRVGDGWSGRVAVAVPEGAGWALVEMWVDARMLGRADG